jgi:hypothetical protein
VTIAGCNDCHTPGYFFGKPDTARFLGGSEVGFQMPGLGVFYAPNLTPDAETGLGKWSAGEIKTALTTGVRPDGRMLAPIMPWHAFANLTAEDADAVVAFLQSLPAVNNKVPGPFGVGEVPTSFVMMIVPGDKGAAPPRPRRSKPRRANPYPVVRAARRPRAPTRAFQPAPTLPAIPAAAPAAPARASAAGGGSARR